MQNLGCYSLVQHEDDSPGRLRFVYHDNASRRGGILRFLQQLIEGLDVQRKGPHTAIRVLAEIPDVEVPFGGREQEATARDQGKVIEVVLPVAGEWALAGNSEGQGLSRQRRKSTL